MGGVGVGGVCIRTAVVAGSNEQATGGSVGRGSERPEKKRCAVGEGQSEGAHVTKGAGENCTFLGFSGKRASRPYKHQMGPTSGCLR